MNIKIVPTVIVIVVFTSCNCLLAGSSPVNQAWLFTQKHPEYANSYTSLSPVSIRYMEMAGEAVSQIVGGILMGVRRYADDPASLKKFLAEIDEVDYAAEFSLRHARLSDRMEAHDSMYYYDYQKDGYRENGIMVIRSGEIVYRYIFEWVSFRGGERREDIDKL